MSQEPETEKSSIENSSVEKSVEKTTVEAATDANSPTTLPAQKPASLSNADAALKLLEEAGDVGVIDEATARRLVRKIDLYIMPLISIVYFLQYIDKIAIGYGSVMGMRTATHLVGNQYNWVSSIFFFGQLFGEFPTIRLLQFFPLAKYASANVIIWGVILACIAACKNYSGLLACRFFLGVAEAAIVPAWVQFTSQWYKKEEQAFRVGIWFSVCGAGQMFGGFVAYGIATHVGRDPSAKLAGWQIMFLFLGLLTVVVGIIFFFVLPDSPVSARFLSPREKAIHAERIRGNQQGIGSNVFKWDQFYEALRDINTWLYAFWVFAANIPNSIATSFGNIMVTGLGYTSTQSLILVTPLGAVEIVALLGLTYLAMKTNERVLWCIAGHIPALVGAILMATTTKAAALVGFYLGGATPIGWTTILGLTSTNVAGSTKKITVAVIQTIAYTVGNIISPQTFQARDAPNYLPAKISICIIYGLCIVDLALIRWVAVRENAKRDKARAEAGDSHVVEKNHEFLDLTDRQNQEFRYAL